MVCRGHSDRRAVLIQQFDPNAGCTNRFSTSEIVSAHFPADSEVRVISVVQRLYVPSACSSVGADICGTKLRTSRESRRFKVTTKVLSGSPKAASLEEQRHSVLT